MINNIFEPGQVRHIPTSIWDKYWLTHWATKTRPQKCLELDLSEREVTFFLLFFDTPLGLEDEPMIGVNKIKVRNSLHNMADN